MDISFLRTEVRCSKCGQWVETERREGGLPEHNDKRGGRCPNSGYSPDDFRYRVKTSGDARRLAKVILDDDDGICLYGGRGHSLRCGDGKYCEKTRLRLSQALAQFVDALSEL